MSSIQRFHAGPRYSECCVHAGTVYVAGQVASNTSNAIEGQTAEILGRIDQLLAEAGTDKSRILMAQVFLSSMADYAGMNSAWDSWVATGHAPCRATVQAPLARPEWKVEIVVTAAA